MTLAIATTSTCPSTSREVYTSTSREVYSVTGFDACMSRQGAVANSSRETTMLLLFHVMGDRVPKVLLDRAICPQRRIDLRGELYEVTPQIAGVDQDLVRLLDDTELKRIIDHLVSLFLISLQDTVYVCQNESTRILFEQSKVY